MGDNVLTGLIPGGSSSIFLFSAPHYEEKWAKVEFMTADLIDNIKPCRSSEEKRKAVTSYVETLIKRHFDCLVYTFGSVPLKTYLPNGDIDIAVFCWQHHLNESWPIDLQNVLKREEYNQHAKFHVKDVLCIHAEVQIVKCLVDNIVVDISFNQLGGLCTLCFLEEVDQLIGQNHLFKRSIILIKAWCYYESRILGAHHGLISTYALETLVLYIFNIFHASLHGPLEVLFKFLSLFSQFDWEHYCLSLWGPIHLTAIKDMTAEPHARAQGDVLLSHEFLYKCSQVNAVFSSGQGIPGRMFVSKHMNVMDPLRINNNLGRSVSRGNLSRIQSAFAFGARKLEKLLSGPCEEIAENLNDFFCNTRNNCMGNRVDAVAMPLASHGTDLENQRENRSSFQITGQSNRAAKMTCGNGMDNRKDFENEDSYCSKFYPDGVAKLGHGNYLNNQGSKEMARFKNGVCSCKFDTLQGPSINEKCHYGSMVNGGSCKSSGIHNKHSEILSESTNIISSLDFLPNDHNYFFANTKLLDPTQGDAHDDEEREPLREVARKEEMGCHLEDSMTTAMDHGQSFVVDGFPCSLSVLSWMQSSPHQLHYVPLESFLPILQAVMDNSIPIVDARQGVAVAHALDGGDVSADMLREGLESAVVEEVPPSSDGPRIGSITYASLEKGHFDILNGDILTHIANLHVGHWILAPQYYEPLAFLPPPVFSSNQEPSCWERPRRLFGDENMLAHGFLLRSAHPPISMNGLSVHSPMFQNHFSKFHHGTGTYLPNLEQLSNTYRERHAGAYNRNSHRIDRYMSSRSGDNAFSSKYHGHGHEIKHEGHPHSNKSSCSSLSSMDSNGGKRRHFSSIHNPQAEDNEVTSIDSSKCGLLKAYPTTRSVSRKDFSGQRGSVNRGHQGLRCEEHQKLGEGLLPLNRRPHRSVQGPYQLRDEDFPPLNQSRKLNTLNIQ